jgi:DNA-binding transcriptional LysR family regulator
VSQKLARLRSFFDDPLLVPGRPAMVLTARAQAVQAPLSRALAELRAAVRVGAPFDPAKAERRFVILANDLFEAYGLPLVLEGLSAEAPHLSFTVERAESDYSDRLEKGTADVAFVPGFALGATLRRLPLPKERFVVLLRGGHRASRRWGLERYLALGHLLVAPRGLPGSLVDDALHGLGKQRRVAARIQHFTSAPFVVARSDLALTCLETIARIAEPFGLLKLPLPVELPMDESFLVWHERAQHDRGHAWLRGKIDDFARSASSNRGRDR